MKTKEIVAAAVLAGLGMAAPTLTKAAVASGLDQARMGIEASARVSIVPLGRVAGATRPTMAIAVKGSLPIEVTFVDDVAGDGPTDADSELARVWVDGMATVELSAEPVGALWAWWTDPSDPGNVVTKILGDGPYGFQTGFDVPGADSNVNALLVADIGNGLETFIGGAFRFLDGVEVNGVARWNGSAWAPLQSPNDAIGITGAEDSPRVDALAAFAEVSGQPARLFVGGRFERAGGIVSNNVARWNGVTWSALGSGTVGVSGPSPSVTALAGLVVGGSRELYVGGSFSSAGGVAAQNIAAWNGSVWSPLGGAGNGTDSDVLALAAYDNGTGVAMYVGGEFVVAGGVSGTQGIVRWNRTAWSSVGGGIDGRVRALMPALSAGQAILLAGGSFSSTVAGLPLENLARFEGSTWSAAAPVGTFPQEVAALAIVPDGEPTSLVCAGQTDDSPAAVSCLFNGSWTPFIGSQPFRPASVTALAVEISPAVRLVAAGNFPPAGTLNSRFLGAWQSTSWFPIQGPGPLFAFGPRSVALDFQVYDDGSGAKLYAGGSFELEGETTAVVRWGGGHVWEALPNPAPFVTDLIVFQGALWAACDGPPGLVRWSQVGLTAHNPDDQVIEPSAGKVLGGSWQVVAPAVDSIEAMAVYNSELYIGGFFMRADGGLEGELEAIARWNGSSPTWSGVGGSGDGVDGYVNALEVFNGELYVGGGFSNTVAGPASNIARWNGTQWNALQGPSGQGANNEVRALAAFAEPGGARLFAGGHFTTAGGIPATGIARWNGSSWSALPGGGVAGTVLSLGVADDTCGPKLWASGEFETAGGSVMRNVARWNGSTWSPAWGPRRDGIDAFATAIIGTEIGGIPIAVLGGFFREAGGIPSRGLAQYRCADIFSAGFEAGNLSEWSASVP